LALCGGASRAAAGGESAVARGERSDITMSEEYLGRELYAGPFKEPDPEHADRLMQTAPAMLQVCRMVVSRFEYRKAHGERFAILDLQIYKRARRAIARVEGTEDNE
jgi:hypothetical protein